MTTPYLARSEGPYNIEVVEQVDGTWVALCDRGDNGPTIGAAGNSPAHAIARVADKLAQMEDECINIFVEDIPRDFHCRCDDVTEAEALHLRIESGAEVKQTYRVGMCCKCNRQGPIHDQDGMVVPYEASGAEVEDADVIEFDPAASN
jgi:hypothetical protein